MHASAEDAGNNRSFGESGENKDFDMGGEAIYFADQVGGRGGLAGHGEVKDDQVGGGFAEGGEQGGGVGQGGDGDEVGGLSKGGFEHGTDERMVVYDDDAGHVSSMFFWAILAEGFDVGQEDICPFILVVGENIPLQLSFKANESAQIRLL